MNILIVYATYSSGTQTAALVLEETLKKLGHATTLKNAKDVDPAQFNNFDLVILGSPSWLINGKEGQPHQYFFSLMEKAKSLRFEGKKFAVFGLGHSAYYALFAGAVDHLVQMVNGVGGKLVGEPLRIDAFYFNQKKNEDILRQWATSLVSQTSS